MLGFDIGHLALLMAIALVVFGPERLQEITRSLARSYNEFQRGLNGWPGPLDGDAVETLPGSVKLSQEIAARRMTFFEHFGELRSRIFKSAIAVFVAAGVCFYFSDFILRILKRPAGIDFQINAFGPFDGFGIRWKVALVAAVVVASPVWIYQLLAFISPGLSTRERRFIVPILLGTATLFLAGTAFGYILLSGMLRVMFSMFGTQINYLPNANQYLSFVIFFMLVSGLVFELPIVLLVLVRLGVLTPALLRSQRKIAYFVLFAFAEIITPVADPIVAPLIVMLPLVILYEGAIFATRWVVPRPAPEAVETGS